MSSSDRMPLLGDSSNTPRGHTRTPVLTPSSLANGANGSKAETPKDDLMSDILSQNGLSRHKYDVISSSSPVTTLPISLSHLSGDSQKRLLNQTPRNSSNTQGSNNNNEDEEDGSNGNETAPLLAAGNIITTSCAIPPADAPPQVQAVIHSHAAQEARNTILGMILVAIATGFMCTVGAIAKNAQNSYDITICELLLGRYFVQHIISWFFWCFRKRKCPRITQRVLETEDVNNPNNNTAIVLTTTTTTQDGDTQTKTIISEAPATPAVVAMGITSNSELLDLQDGAHHTGVGVDAGVAVGSGIPTAINWYGDHPHRLNIWLRALLLWFVIFFYWNGLNLVPIGDAEAIFFLSPLFTVIIARIYLKEELPKMFGFTFFLTIFGVIFICQPAFVFNNSPEDSEAISWVGFLLVFASVLCWSFVCILVRTAKEAHWLQLELVSSFESAFILTPVLIIVNKYWWKLSMFDFNITWDFYFESMDSNGLGIINGRWVIILVLSLFGFVGLMCSVIGYQIGDATKVAWMEYLDLVFAFIYQWLAFDDEPNMWEFIGCAFLFSVCVIHLLEELVIFMKKRMLEKKAMEKVSEIKHLAHHEHEHLLNNNNNNNNKESSVDECSNGDSTEKCEDDDEIVIDEKPHSKYGSIITIKKIENYHHKIKHDSSKKNNNSGTPRQPPAITGVGAIDSVMDQLSRYSTMKNDDGSGYNQY